MSKVIVKKRKIEKELGNLKIVYVVYDKVEVHEDLDRGVPTEIVVSQIWDVIEVWEFEDVNEIFATRVGRPPELKSSQKK